MKNIFKIFRSKENDSIEASGSVYIPIADKVKRASQEDRKETVFFWNGLDRIDMVLAYNDTTKEKARIRRRFAKNLLKKNLNLELEPAINSMDQKTNFLKISAPWNVLTTYAEMLNFRMPIKKQEHFSELKNSTSSKSSMDERLMSMAKDVDKAIDKVIDYNRKMVKEGVDYYTAKFIKEKEDRFAIEDRATFFTPAQRSNIVWQILNRTPYGSKETDVGIVRLLGKGIYKGAFPLHDGRYDKDLPDGSISERRRLYLAWARFDNFYRKQPLWAVKRYFGDKIALYFAWTGLYTGMLTIPALLGLFVMLFGISTMGSELDYPNTEICDRNSTGGFLMCPLPQCNDDHECRFVPIWESACNLSKWAYIFDNHATIPFAMCLSIWATILLGLWKRRHAQLRFDWDLTKQDEDEQIVRPEFESSAKHKRINPVTNNEEAYLPRTEKYSRIAITYAFILFVICSAIGITIGVMFYKLISLTLLNESDLGGSEAKLINSVTTSLLSLTISLTLKMVYKLLAKKLTDLEMHRTQIEYENSYAFKRFVFQSVNFYSTLFYIAFFKNKFYTTPEVVYKNESEFVRRFTGDICSEAGCFWELAFQTFIMMMGDMIVGIIMQLLKPTLKVYWNRKHWSGQQKKLNSRWERDYTLVAMDRLKLTDEYLHCAKQYGFVMFFSMAFPLAPLLALIHNIIGIRIDAYKFVARCRRPVAQRTPGIGIWLKIFKFITYLSIIVNAVTIALESDFIPHIVYATVYSKEEEGPTLKGYVEFTLTPFNTSDWGELGSPDWTGPNYKSTNISIPRICYFKGFRDATQSHYPVARKKLDLSIAELVFIFVYEHVITVLTGCFVLFIPDIPRKVRNHMRREKLLTQEILYGKEMYQTGPGEVGEWNINEDPSAKTVASPRTRSAITQGVRDNDPTVASSEASRVSEDKVRKPRKPERGHFRLDDPTVASFPSIQSSKQSSVNEGPSKDARLDDPTFNTSSSKTPPLSQQTSERKNRKGKRIKVTRNFGKKLKKRKKPEK